MLLCRYYRNILHNNSIDCLVFALSQLRSVGQLKGQMAFVPLRLLNQGKWGGKSWSSILTLAMLFSRFN